MQKFLHPRCIFENFELPGFKQKFLVTFKCFFSDFLSRNSKKVKVKNFAGNGRYHQILLQIFDLSTLESFCYILYHDSNGFMMPMGRYIRGCENVCFFSHFALFFLFWLKKLFVLIESSLLVSSKNLNLRTIIRLPG